MRNISFLKKRVRDKSRLAKRVSRLDEKLLELYKNNDIVKRYVAMTQLRSSYVIKIRDAERSIENVACRIIEEGESFEDEEPVGTDAAEQLRQER